MPKKSDLDHLVPSSMKARFIQEVGTRAWLRVYWGDDCPDCGGHGSKGYHNAQIFLTDSDKIGDWDLGGEPEDYPPERWPTKCDHCDALVSPQSGEDEKAVHFQVFRKRRYNTASGLPEPGDLYWGDWYGRKEGGGCVLHDNCDGRHLFAILPNGHEWDIDGRASNCTKPKDRIHRCWIREGTPPNVTVGKGKRGDDTCGAGGGSIQAGNYHGFLKNGSFT